MTDRRDDQDTYVTQRQSLVGQAVSTLTAAARLRVPGYGRMDFAGFLAEVLASVAADLGSVEAITAGRPGSWEADLVHQLVAGTVGWDGEYLIEHRTEPVAIHLNVHDLMLARATEASDWQTAYEVERDAIEARHDAAFAASGRTVWEDADVDALLAEQEAAEARWRARYEAFGVEFTAAVQAEAARIEGLHVPVTVNVQADPEPQNATDIPPHPEDTDVDDPAFDPLALRLWQAALNTLTLPCSTSQPDADQPVPGEQPRSGESGGGEG